MAIGDKATEGDGQLALVMNSQVRIKYRFVLSRHMMRVYGKSRINMEVETAAATQVETGCCVTVALEYKWMLAP